MYFICCLDKQLFVSAFIFYFDLNQKRLLFRKAKERKFLEKNQDLYLDSRLVKNMWWACIVYTIHCIGPHIISGFVTESEDSKDPQTETRNSSKRRLSKEEYVGIIVDILKLRKNVCLCRHFQSLNKDSLFSLERKSVFDPKTPKKLYIDVWLVDFFSPSYTNVCDTSSLFILQLVNIRSSVCTLIDLVQLPHWSKLHEESSENPLYIFQIVGINCCWSLKCLKYKLLCMQENHFPQFVYVCMPNGGCTAANI